MILAKKDKETLDGLVSNLTEEQKKKLEDNQVEDFDEKKAYLDSIRDDCRSKY